MALKIKKRDRLWERVPRNYAEAIQGRRMVRNPKLRSILECMRAGNSLQHISNLTGMPEEEIVSRFVSFFYPSGFTPKNPRNIFVVCQRLHSSGKRVSFEDLGRGLLTRKAVTRINSFFKIVSPEEQRQKVLRSVSEARKISQKEINRIIALANQRRTITEIHNITGHDRKTIKPVMQGHTLITQREIGRRGQMVTRDKLSTLTPEQRKKGFELLEKSRMSYGEIAAAVEKSVGGIVSRGQIVRLDHFYNMRSPEQRKEIGFEVRERKMKARNAKTRIVDQAIREGKSTQEIIALLNKYEEKTGIKAKERSNKKTISTRRRILRFQDAERRIKEKSMELSGPRAAEMMQKQDILLASFTTGLATNFLTALGKYDAITISNCLHYLTNPVTEPGNRSHVIRQIMEGKPIELK